MQREIEEDMKREMEIVVQQGGDLLLPLHARGEKSEDME